MIAALTILFVGHQGAQIARGLPSRTAILTYHDVLSKRTKASLWFDCSIGEFRAQLDWLTQRGAKFVSLDTVQQTLLGKRRPQSSEIAITFADNYEGFIRYAWPELKRRGIPVTQFAHTDYVGSRVGRPKATVAQLREALKSPLFRLESQTCSHPENLADLSDRQLQRELVDSMRWIQRNLGKRSTFIAYPNGKFNARVKRAAQLAGYAMGFSEAQLPAERSPDRFEVARYVHTKYREAWAAISAPHKRKSTSSAKP